MIQDILALIFLSLIVSIFWKSYFSKNHIEIFSPIVFICLFYIYYIIYPFYFSKQDFFGLNKTTEVSLLLFGGIVNLCGIIVGFKLINPKQKPTINNMFNDNNVFKCAIWYFAIGFIAYISINGFSFNFVTERTDLYFTSEHRFNHTNMYITGLTSLFPAAACLFYASGKWRYNIPLFVIAIIICLIGGSRNRILLFLVPFIVFYHLYPFPKKINFKLWIPLAFVFVISMGVIEKTRNYSKGLDIEKLMNLSDDIVGKSKASESDIVYYFSAKVMDTYMYSPILIKDVLGTAICLPIPRAIFPQKPDAQYLRDANVRTLGTEDYGAAYLNIVEAFLAFGWFGIFFNGFIIGWLSKIFWGNYQRNPNSIGAVMFLGLFDGVTYILISRGYLAQEFLIFAYYIIVNYWIGRLILKFGKQRQILGK